MSSEGLRNHPDEDSTMKLYDLRTAQEDGTLHFVGSTYSHENDAVYDGLSRPGMRLVTFSPILKHKIFPLPQILELLLDMGTWGMGTAVEIEFAVNMSVPRGERKEFGVLQMRPLVVSRDIEEMNLEDIDQDRIFCRSSQVLGNGTIDNICDIITVNKETFDRSKTKAVAEEVSYFNKKLTAEGRPYLLIGLGRWGTLDPWLGIPITWSQISGARTIIEAEMQDISVQPSQGSHFFQNITSFMIGYFTVNTAKNDGYLDWEWIDKLQAEEEKKYIRHIKFDNPLNIKMSSRKKTGIILKPEA